MCLDEFFRAADLQPMRRHAETDARIDLPRAVVHPGLRAEVTSTLGISAEELEGVPQRALSCPCSRR